MKNKKEAEKKPVNKEMIYNIVLWSVGAILIFLVLFWDVITGKQTLWGKDGNGFVGFYNWLISEKTVRGFIVTIIAVVIVLVIVSLMKVLGKAIGVKNKKAATIFSLVRSLIKWAAIITAVFIVLTAWGADMKNIVISMGILALIIGLGCQTLISDIVAGIFLVADNAFEVGDIVVVDDFRGTVVEIGLKSTKIEDAGGNIKIISNSNISSMVNLTDSLSLAIVEISIPYEENLSRTETLLIQHLKDMQKRIPAIVEGPYYKGVEDMADSAVILKVIAKVKEEDRFQATRDMKRDIYIFLNDNAITVPYPQLTITQGPNPADHPEWVDKEKEEAKALREAEKMQEESKDLEHVNDVK